jgi:hypothetical protein
VGYELKKKIGLLDWYCKYWYWRCNFNKSKILIFKKGGKLKAMERWNMNE